MIIDTHGHVSAPAELYAYKAGLLAARGYHGSKAPKMSDDLLRDAMAEHIQLLKRVQTDVQFLSARPFQLMHSERPAKIVEWWVRANNDVIARQVALEPGLFRGVAALPQSPDTDLGPSIAELERCVNELGFIGVLINPDPSEGLGTTPPMGDPSWYPLYEKMIELDVPGLVHSAGCVSPREHYSGHFITEESINILSLIDHKVLDRYPTLKLVIPHGGGSIPYQIGRWRAHRGLSGESVMAFDADLRKLNFDAVLYNQESIEFLIRMVGDERVLFATEKPGSGSAKDDSGADLDDLKPVIERIDWLSSEARARIFEGNARRLYTRFQ